MSFWMRRLISYLRSVLNKYIPQPENIATWVWGGALWWIPMPLKASFIREHVWCDEDSEQLQKVFVTAFSTALNHLFFFLGENWSEGYSLPKVLSAFLTACSHICSSFYSSNDGNYHSIISIVTVNTGYSFLVIFHELLEISSQLPCFTCSENKSS